MANRKIYIPIGGGKYDEIEIPEGMNFENAYNKISKIYGDQLDDKVIAKEFYSVGLVPSAKDTGARPNVDYKSDKNKSANVSLMDRLKGSLGNNTGMQDYFGKKGIETVVDQGGLMLKDPADNTFKSYDPNGLKDLGLLLKRGLPTVENIQGLLDPKRAEETKQAYLRMAQDLPSDLAEMIAPTIKGTAEGAAALGAIAANPLIAVGTAPLAAGATGMALEKGQQKLGEKLGVYKNETDSFFTPEVVQEGAMAALLGLIPGAKGTYGAIKAAGKNIANKAITNLANSPEGENALVNLLGLNKNKAWQDMAKENPDKAKELLGTILNKIPKDVKFNDLGTWIKPRMKEIGGMFDDALKSGKPIDPASIESAFLKPVETGSFQQIVPGVPATEQGNAADYLKGYAKQIAETPELSKDGFISPLALQEQELIPLGKDPKISKVFQGKFTSDPTKYNAKAIQGLRDVLTEATGGAEGGYAKASAEYEPMKYLKDALEAKAADPYTKNDISFARGIPQPSIVDWFKSPVQSAGKTLTRQAFTKADMSLNPLKMSPESLLNASDQASFSSLMKGRAGELPVNNKYNPGESDFNLTAQLAALKSLIMGMSE